MNLTRGGMLIPGKSWTYNWHEECRDWRFMPWNGPMRHLTSHPLKGIAKARAFRRMIRKMSLNPRKFL